MIKTPFRSDLGGKYADEVPLLRFYNKEVEDVILNSSALEEVKDEEFEIEGLLQGETN